MYMTAVVVALLGVAVGLGGSAVGIGLPYLLVLLLTFVGGYLGAASIVHRLCSASLPASVWRRILQLPGLNRFDPVQATLNFVPRRERPVRHVSVCLHQETEAIFDLIVRDFVMSWYEWISNDQFVPDEVAMTLHDVLERAHGLFQQVDQYELFREIILLGRIHVTCYQLAVENVDRKESAPDYHEGLARQYQKELSKLVDNQLDSGGEQEFLRRVADLLLGMLLPMSDLGCEPARQLLNDVLSVNVLQQVVELIIDPDWINEIIVIALSETPKETLEMIESFDESPKEKEQNSPSEELKKTIGYPAISTVGQATSARSTASERTLQYPVAPAAAAASLAVPAAEHVRSRCDLPEITEADALGESEDDVGLDCSAIVSKLGSDVIGIVGRQLVRRSSLEMEYVSYDIQFKPALLWPETKFTFEAVREVSRRYKQFDALFARMKDNVRLSKTLQGIDLPGKRILPLLTQAQADEFGRTRQEQLDAFLKAICTSAALRQCEEFKSFLSDGAMLGLPLTRIRSDIIRRPLTRVFDVVTDVLRPRSHSGLISDALPAWHSEVGDKGAVGVFRAFTRSYSTAHLKIDPATSAQGSDGAMTAVVASLEPSPAAVEWELRCLQWQHRTDQAVHSTWRGQNTVECEDALRSVMSLQQQVDPRPELEPRSLCPRDADFAILDRRWPVATALIELGTGAIAEQNLLKSDLVQKLMLCGIGAIVDRFVCSELDELLRERRLAYIVRLLRETLWPDGHWPETSSPVTKSEEERQAAKEEALKSLKDFLPGFLRVFVGPSAYDRAFAQLVESLQHREINRCLAYALFNVVLESLASFRSPSDSPQSAEPSISSKLPAS